MMHFYETVAGGLAALSHQEAVERYARGASVPGEAIRGLTHEQLLSYPVPGTWSIQQIVLHLMDTDLIAAYRMKRIIAEDEPRLDVYDEARFADLLGYETQDAVQACEVFRLNRLVTAQMLRGLSDDAFAREAHHPEMGALSLARLVRVYVQHLNHHLKFIERKRRLVTVAGQ